MLLALHAYHITSNPSHSQFEDLTRLQEGRQGYLFSISSQKPVFRIRIILMRIRIRIRIRGSASGMMDPDPGPVQDTDPDPDPDPDPT